MTSISFEIVRLKPGLPDLASHIQFLCSSYFDALTEENQTAPMGCFRKVDRQEGGKLSSYFSELVASDDYACLLIALDSFNRSPMGYFMGVVKECMAETPSRVGYINGLYVLPEERKRGIAQSLFDQGMAWFECQSLSLVELYVSTGNQAAKGFWRKNGFSLNEEVWAKAKI